MATIKYIAVHNTGGLASDVLAYTQNLSIEQIDKSHKEREFGLSKLGYYVGYNLLIFSNGLHIQTRIIGEETCAQKGHNFDTISICLLGNFTNGAEQPTFAQKMKLKALMQAILSNKPERMSLVVNSGTVIDVIKDRVVPHRFLQSNTSCYGNLLSDSWAKNLLEPEKVVNIRAEIELLKTLVDKLLKLLSLRQSLGSIKNNCCDIDVKN